MLDKAEIAYIMVLVCPCCGEEHLIDFQPDAGEVRTEHCDNCENDFIVPTNKEFIYEWSN